MPRSASGPAWFEDLFGFKESSSYSGNQAHFRMEGETMVCEAAPKHKRHFVGRWTTPSLSELRAELAESAADGGSGPIADADGDGRGLDFRHLATPVGVEPLILDPANAGAVFQAASQFNALEMTGPGVSPRRGVAIYIGDPTQGPKCALACPGGTVFRNYLVEHGTNRGQGDVQIDCLADVGAIVGNADGDKYWKMQNGYCLPSGPGSIKRLATRLEAEPALAAEAEAALRVGVHWETQTRPPHEHRVCQVYASALPVAYAPSAKAADWEPFARLVLRAAYEATLAVGTIKALRAGGGERVAVFLTSLGGGAFGNRQEWIVDALKGALETHRDSPLDVTLVHYGTRVPNEWRGLSKSKPP